MESLYTSIVDLPKAVVEVEKILRRRYKVENANLSKTILSLPAFLNELRTDLFVFIEHPYVDKTYRDTYYNYFASKARRLSKEY